MKNKIKALIFLSIITLFIASCSNSAPESVRNYDIIVNPADKIVLSDYGFGTKAFPPSMETNLRFPGTVIIDGTLIENTEFIFSNPFYGTEMLGEVVTTETIALPIYVIKVKEVTGDEYNEELIYCGIRSDVTVPEIGENVIIFASKAMADGYIYYIPVADEHSIFTYEDKKERLYSFSNTEELSAFDGKHKSELFEVVMASDNFKNAVN